MTYVNEVPDDEDILELMKYQERAVLSFFMTIPEEKGNYAYESGKWSIKEVLQHLIDVERIFTLRALLLSRGEKQAIPGFDQDEYMEALDLSETSVDALNRDFLATRKSTISFFSSISEEMSKRKGIVSGGVMSVRTCAFIIAGHLNHHERVLRQRYLT